MVEVAEESPYLFLFFIPWNKKFKCAIFLCIYSWLSRPLRCDGNKVSVLFCQSILKHEISTIFWSDSCSNKETCIVHNAVKGLINICFSNTCACSCENNIAFSKSVIIC